MATIDKSLPNEVRKEINIPSEEELQVEFEQETGPQDAILILQKLILKVVQIISRTSLNIYPIMY